MTDFFSTQNSRVSNIGNPISNNTACLVLDKAALDLCYSTFDTCMSTGFQVFVGSNLIAIPIVALAGEIAIEAITDTGLLFRDFAKYASGIRTYEQIQEMETQIKEDPFWKRGVKSVKRLTIAASLTCIAIVTLKIGNLFSESNCRSMTDSCPTLANHTVEACNWTNEFLISVIEQVIKHHFS